MWKLKLCVHNASTKRLNWDILIEWSLWYAVNFNCMPMYVNWYGNCCYKQTIFGEFKKGVASWGISIVTYLMYWSMSLIRTTEVCHWYVHVPLMYCDVSIYHPISNGICHEIKHLCVYVHHECRSIFTIKIKYFMLITLQKYSVKWSIWLDLGKLFQILHWKLWDT